MDRACASGAQGQRFESSRARQKPNKNKWLESGAAGGPSVLPWCYPGHSVFARNAVLSARPPFLVISIGLEMTQVITAITNDYVLLVADRRLTYDVSGQLADDNACKLVSLCNVCGIGYTGLAEIERIPTHEWIAMALAAEHCSDPSTASRILAARATIAFSRKHKIHKHTFVITGWAYFENLTGLRPFVGFITNTMNEAGQLLPKASNNFCARTKALHDAEELWLSVSGEPVLLERGNALERNLRKLIAKEISSKAALRFLVDEVIHTAGQVNTVGNKILALCIPRKAAQETIDSGTSPLLAAQPNEDTASFCYFEPTYSELQQFGPTVTCGGSAFTDVKTQNDASTNFQSSSVKILAISNRRNSPTVQQSPVFKRTPLGASGRPSFGFDFGVALDHAVLAGKAYTIRAAVRNTGQRSISFARQLSDGVGQEVRPSVQGGAVPAITFSPPTGDWAMTHFDAGSRSQFRRPRT